MAKRMAVIALRNATEARMNRSKAVRLIQRIRSLNAMVFSSRAA
jgi:hypothetical protein